MKTVTTNKRKAQGRKGRNGSASTAQRSAVPKEVSNETAKAMTERQLAALPVEILKDLYTRTKSNSPEGDDLLHWRVEDAIRPLAAKHDECKQDPLDCPLCWMHEYDSLLKHERQEANSEHKVQRIRETKSDQKAPHHPSPHVSDHKPERTVEVDRREKSSRQTTGWFKTPNAIFDWELPRAFRPAYRLVWLALNRHANERPGRLVKAISQARIARATGLGKSTVERASAFLKEVGLLEVEHQGGVRRGEQRLTSVYRVADLQEFDRKKLYEAISRSGAATE